MAGEDITFDESDIAPLAQPRVYVDPQARPRITVGGTQPAPPPSADVTFDEPVAAPQSAAAVAPGQPNKMFGELKPADPSWTQWAKWKAQDLIGLSPAASNYDAMHLGNAAIDIAGLTPLGSILSAADLTYDLPRGNYVGAGLDVLGMIPGGMMARNALKAAKPVRNAAGKLNTAKMITAEAAPSYLQDVPSVVGGDNPQRMGFATPTVDELIGRGGAPNVSSNPSRAAYEAMLPPAAGPSLPANTPPGSARNAYAQIRYTPMMYDPAAANDVAYQIEQHIQSPAVGGFTQFKAPLVYDTVRDFERQMAAHGGPITPSDFDQLRQSLRGLPDANGPAGEQAIRALDQYMFQPPPGRIIAGTPQDLAEMRQNFQIARGDWRAGKTAETVQNAIDRADLNAASAHSGMNVGNQTRQQLRSLIATPEGQEKIFGASDPERLAILNTVRGDTSANLKRNLANVLGGGGGLGKLVAKGAGAGAGGFLGGMVGMPVGGSIVGSEGAGIFGGMLKRAENRAVVNSAEDAVQGILRNSPEYRSRTAGNVPAPFVPISARGETVADPRVIARNAIAQALVGNPATRNWLQNKWYGLYGANR